ncbi:MAG: glycerol kinase GlpK [Clostridiales bacterium]|nr:glycerol kinase GlpK [Clostridiales bacterium]
MKYVLALDQGTTSTRAIIFNKKGEIVGSAQQEFKQIYPRAGWVEHDPTDIVGSAVGVIAEALIRANIVVGDLAAIGITNQRETTIVWDKNTGAPVYNAIVWQCRRTADMAARLKSEGLSSFIYDRTGLVPDAYFSATKIKWILDSVEGARERAERGELLFGTVDTYLMWRLSHGKIFATDYTNASRTMLFNIHTLEWDKELLKLFDIPESMLPKVLPSGGLFGYTDKGVIGGEVPVCGVAGDQQAALFGQLCVGEGDVKNTYGTGCFLLLNTGDKAVRSRNGLVTTLGACAGGKPPYVLEGSVFVGGAVVQWLRDELGLISSAAESETFAASVKGTGGVYVVPAFTGLGAPYWEADARGIICGITRGTGKAHIIRAALEAIAYQSADLVAAMERDAGIKINALRVDGGASANDFLMAFQSDILGVKLQRPAVVETTALGAAYLAGLSCGYWSGVDELKIQRRVEREFVPSMTEEDRAAALAGWRSAVDKARL